MRSRKIAPEVRLQAYDLLKYLKEKGVPRKKIIDIVYRDFNISNGSLYSWYSGNIKPFGRRENLANIPELFYVLGALLGDGCLYNWNVTQHRVIISGEEEFTKKYARRVSRCTGEKTRAYINRTRNHWFVNLNNFKLYYLFKKIRENLDFLNELAHQDKNRRFILFIEGFFDAEGCVKIIKEKARKTPKICLDITNTNKCHLDFIQKLLQTQLNIEARYSIQEPRKHWKSNNKKIAYHLRIYKKEYIRKFFENISTIKLKKEKIKYVDNWLNNGLGS